MESLGQAISLGIRDTRQSHSVLGACPVWRLVFEPIVTAIGWLFTTCIREVDFSPCKVGVSFSAPAR